MAEEEEQQASANIGSEFVFDFYCEFCIEDGKMLEAEGYCVGCKEYLCSTCYTCHRRSRGNRHHVLMDKNEMPKDTPLSHDQVNKDISKICSHHNGKTVKYYCKSHDFLGCSVCIIKGHRNCSDVENIPELAETVMESQEYKDFIEMLNRVGQKSFDNIDLVQDNLTKSQSWCSDVVKSVQNFREEINSILDELEKSIIIQAETFQKEEEQKLMNVSDNVKTSLESVEKIIAELDQLQSSRKVCEVFIKLKESKKEATEIQVKMTEAEKENAVSEYAFDPNTKLKEYLNSKNVLGTLSAQTSATAVAMVMPHNSDANTKNVAMAPSHNSAVSTEVVAMTMSHISDVSTKAVALTMSHNSDVSTKAVALTMSHNSDVRTKAVAMALPQYNPANTKAKHVTDIEVKYSKDKNNCRITGSAVVSNNRLIIVNCNNRKVKLIDTQSNKVISELTVSSNPWDVTVIGRNQAAVTLWFDSTILLLSVSDTLTLNREIAVDGGCRGVAYSRDRLVVTYISPVKLEIMDLSGKVMKKVENDSDGHKLFTCPQYVCVSKDEETIYVSDYNSNKVTSLTFDGVVKSVYSGSELKGPEKVCVDHHGNVYVCCYFSTNVHMLTADLTKIQIILTRADGLGSSVYSVSHCQETNRLYVGMENNKVKVYQLSQ